MVKDASVSLDPSDSITPHEVLSGVGAAGLTWTVEVGGSRAQVRLALRVCRDGKWLTGPSISALPIPPSLMSYGFGYGGSDDDQVRHVLVGVHSSVERVVVLTDQRVELAVPLSDLDPEFGVRFGAVVLPYAEVPVEVRAVVAGSTVEVHSTVIRRRPLRPEAGGAA